MTLHDIMADLRVTRRFPTDAECEIVAREGTAAEATEMLNFSCGTSKPLLKRYNKERRASLLPPNQWEISK